MDERKRLEIDETSNKRKYWDNLLGNRENIKDINSFVGYCELHSKTPRALFSADDVEIMRALVGCNREEREEANPFYFWQAIYYDRESFEKMRERVSKLE